MPPGVVPYLMHPWVIANDRLKATGWAPQHSNEEAILDGIDALPVPPSPLRIAVLAGAAVAVGAAAGWLLRRYRKRA